MRCIEKGEQELWSLLNKIINFYELGSCEYLSGGVEVKSVKDKKVNNYS